VRDSIEPGVAPRDIQDVKIIHSEVVSSQETGFWRLRRFFSS
jgi:hypothetical protein